MADVDVQVTYTTEKKTRKVKKGGKHRDSTDMGQSDVTITEMDSNSQGYVLAVSPLYFFG